MTANYAMNGASRSLRQVIVKTDCAANSDSADIFGRWNARIAVLRDDLDCRTVTDSEIGITDLAEWTPLLLGRKGAKSAWNIGGL